MTFGTTKMPVLFVVNLDTLVMVYLTLLCFLLYCTILYTGAIAASGYYTDYHWPFGIIDLNCTGNESSIWNCTYNGTSEFYSCSSSHDASVICQGDLDFIS